jgi:hypothetical protein
MSRPVWRVLDILNVHRQTKSFESNPQGGTSNPIEKSLPIFWHQYGVAHQLHLDQSIIILNGFAPE